MTMPDVSILPENIDATKADNPNDPSVKEHQQHHDLAHAALKALIPKDQKGVANGVATLDTGKKIPLEQLPSNSNAVTSVDGATGAVVLVTDAAVGTGSKRTLGTGALQAAAGNDARITGAIPSTQKGAASGVATLDAGSRVPLAQLPPLVQSTKTAAYTVVLGDQNTLVEFDSASALTLTIPANASVIFPVGTIIGVRQYGAGQVTVAPAAGVTIRSRGAALKTAGQYAEATLTKRGTDEWVVAGDLVA